MIVIGQGDQDSRMATFEGNIKEIRKKLGWSGQRMAHEVGVSESTVRRWEQGTTQPSSLAVQQLERVLERAGVPGGGKTLNAKP